MGHRIVGRARAGARRVRSGLARRVLRAHAVLARPALRAHAVLARRALRAHGAVTARALAARGALAGRTGQGTVEYVALILLVAGLFATVVVAAGGIKGDGIAKAITDKIKSTIESVGAKQG
jgi:hypothetical protein